MKITLKIATPSYAVMRRLGLEARKKKLPCIIVPQATPRASLMRGSYSKREDVDEPGKAQGI